ncbi:MAG: glycosyltransferase family 4 protein [Vampirovibrionia bacterium]
MRVAILTETFLPQVNGVVRTVEKIIKYLEKNRHEVLLITIGDGEECYSSTQVVRVPGIPFGLYKELNLVKPEDELFAKFLDNEFMQLPIAALQSLIPSSNKVVEEALYKFQPDIIHLVTPVTLGAVGHYYIEKMKLPSLATFHTDIAAYAPRYQIPYVENIINVVTKMIYSKADRVLAPSPSSKAQLESIGIENVGVFGRGVDHKLFNPSKADKEKLETYGLSSNKLTVLYAGRLAEEKSLEKLVESFKHLLIKYPEDIQLLIVGEGPSRIDLEAALAGASNYAFTGLKTGEELASLYASADIFAFPSVTETFGQVVLEAMASGLPVLGFDSPGVRDLIEQAVSGFLADPKVDYLDTVNPLSFIYNLEALIKDSAWRKKLGDRAFAIAQQRSWDAILAELVSEYEILINAANKKLLRA